MSDEPGVRMTPRRVIAGNWKMHKGPSETRAFLRSFDPEPPDEGVLLLLFPPALSVAAAVEECPDALPLAIGVQNVHWEEEGAFTGEISARMAADAGASHVLVGHSERRHVFGETDEEVARKVRAALRHRLRPVICVGETLAERRAGRLEEVIVRQLEAALDPLSGGDAPFMVAYEPVWAIGTGETATPEDAAGAHGVLRRTLEQALDGPRAEEVPILYGGSVKPHNAAELLRAAEVDGVLVGGASLDPDDFAAIAAALPDGGATA